MPKTNYTKLPNKSPYTPTNDIEPEVVQIMDVQGKSTLMLVSVPGHPYLFYDPNHPAVKQIENFQHVGLH